MRKVCLVFCILPTMMLWAHSGHDHEEELGMMNYAKAALRITNMHKAQSVELNLEKGKKMHWDAVHVTLKDCMASSHDRSNFWALIEIKDTADTVRFNGWLNSRYPAASPMNDPTYDVLLQGCE